MTDDKSTGRDPRISNLDVVQVWNEEKGGFDTAHTDNISKSGLFVITDRPLPVGSKVRLKFSLISGGGHGEEIKLKAVDVWGEVIHCITEQDMGPGMKPGMGVRFMDLPPDIRKTIDDIISEELEPTPTS